jgi:hypothetical protein
MDDSSVCMDEGSDESGFSLNKSLNDAGRRASSFFSPHVPPGAFREPGHSAADAMDSDADTEVGADDDVHGGRGEEEEEDLSQEASKDSHERRP